MMTNLMCVVVSKVEKKMKNFEKSVVDTKTSLLKVFNNSIKIDKIIQTCPGFFS